MDSGADHSSTPSPRDSAQGDAAQGDAAQGDAGQGDAGQEELLQWLNEYGDEVYQYARARVESDAAAEELVQDTYLAALKNFTQFQGRAQPKTWLIAILRNKIVEHYRRRAKTREREKSLEHAADDDYFERGIWKSALGKWPQRPSQDMEADEFWRAFDACVAELPPLLAQAFVLRTVDEESTENVCKTLGISATNLAVRLHRARLGLRSCLERSWFGER